MSALTDSARVALEPYVGPVVADTCIRATAISLGKTADELSGADSVALEQSVRKLLMPIAAPATIDTIVIALHRASEEG
ncbi:MAG: hypothetical protein FDZ75_08670 [Actinobacteria bacterium]|nr:MAG: hypothetical protein FDZ75_08670 [Actinomycetota bacterium]